jgi:peptide/nickel transport system ATP-binding protein
MSVILVTHDLGVVAGRAHEIAVMYAGRIVEMAPTPKLFADMRMPYTEALFESIPKLNLKSHTRLNVIPGRPPDLINPPTGCSFAPRCSYAQPRCLEEDPPLTVGADPDHRFACFYPVGTPEGREALAENRERGVQAAGVPVALIERAAG